MSDKNTFKTKTGFCHVLPDRIELSREGVAGKVAQATVGNGIERILFLYGAIAIALFYFAFSSYRYDLQFQAIVFFAVGIFLAFEVFSSLNNSTASIISRQQIENIKFKKGIPWLTRSRFEVFFKNEEGKMKKRLIMLPGSLKEGRAEAERALDIMKGEKLI